MSSPHNFTEGCWICGRPKGQPPDRCPGHYEMPDGTLSGHPPTRQHQQPKQQKGDRPMFHLTITIELFDYAAVYRIGRRPFADDPEYQRQKAVSQFLQEIRRSIRQLAPHNTHGTLLLDAATEGADKILRPCLEDIYNWGYLTWHDYPPQVDQRKPERIRRAILAAWSWRLSEELLTPPAQVKALVLAVRPYNRPILADPASQMLLPLRAAIFAAAAPYLNRAWEQGNNDARDDIAWSRMWPDLMKEAYA